MFAMLGMIYFPSMSQKKQVANRYAAKALALHKKLRGKLSVVSKVPLETREDWSTLYTPGVGAVSSYIAEHPESARMLTMRNNTVAVISDGSAVLGLGNIGPAAALPVMEGKAVIFKAMAGIDAIPIVLNTQDPKKVIEIVKGIAPTFGGINLEDFAAPHCFEIERALVEALDIPVMHDDQHGTAIVVLAGLINAAKVVKKKFADLRVVIVGAGAAGRAIALLLMKAGIVNVVVCDRTGALVPSRKDMKGYKKELAAMTNPERRRGAVEDVVAGADVLIGVSGPGSITPAHVASMASDAVVFALANPIPEIMPDVAHAAGARIVATGRSDFPNQINNALAFPGIFRGALDKQVTRITDETKLAAAKAIASMVKKPSAEEIIPSVMAKGLAKTVAKAVR